MEVLDFYASKRMSIHKVLSTLMSPVDICILVKFKGEVKEWCVSIPKRYRFTRKQYLQGYDFKKFEVYVVLLDYLTSSSRSLKCKWGLTDKEFRELLIGIQECLVRKYFNGGILAKVHEFLKVKALLLLNFIT